MTALRAAGSRTLKKARAPSSAAGLEETCAEFEQTVCGSIMRSIDPETLFPSHCDPQYNGSYTSKACTLPTKTEAPPTQVAQKSADHSQVNPHLPQY